MHSKIYNTFLTGKIFNECSLRAIKVYSALARCLDEETNTCNCTQTQLSEMTGINQSHVCTCLKELRDKGYITITTEPGKQSKYGFKFSGWIYTPQQLQQYNEKEEMPTMSEQRLRERDNAGVSAYVVGVAPSQNTADTKQAEIDRIVRELG